MANYKNSIQSFLYEADIVDDRVNAVHRAMKMAVHRAPRAIRDVTGENLSEISHAIVPTIIGFLGIIFVTTAVGAVAGAALGAMFFGAGAAPGAIIGSRVGFSTGIVLLEWLGLAFLVAYIGSGLMQAQTLARAGLKEAWRAPENKTWEGGQINRAADKLAQATALIVDAILQGLVQFLLARGTASAAKRVPELVAKLKSSRFGASFALWVEKNGTRLIAKPKYLSKAGNTETAIFGPKGSDPFPVELEPVRVPKRENSTAQSLNEPFPSPKIQSQRRELARKWYQQHGYDADTAMSRGKGFDLKKPLEEVTLKPGTRLEQWVVEGKKPGLDFTEYGADPSKLGIQLEGRTRMIFEVKEPITVLKGTAGDFPVGLYKGVGGPGGSPQIAMPPGWQSKIVLVQ